MKGRSRRSPLGHNGAVRRGGIVATALALIVSVWTPPTAGAQESEPNIHGTYRGDPMYSVLPAGAIPAIDEPEFVSGTEADTQMQPDEPVLGLVVGDVVRAYSLWQLDAHEIVNDVVGDLPIAAMW
jgi:hypothetical protein